MALGGPDLSCQGLKFGILFFLIVSSLPCFEEEGEEEEENEEEEEEMVRSSRP